MPTTPAIAALVLGDVLARSDISGQPELYAPLDERVQKFLESRRGT